MLNGIGVIDSANIGDIETMEKDFTDLLLQDV
jgi:hypothetical protein